MKEERKVIAAYLVHLMIPKGDLNDAAYSDYVI
jgi:hypothetical protein